MASLNFSGAAEAPASSPPPAQVIPEWKLILVGDGGVGKTTWVEKVLTDDFREFYRATLGVKVRCINFETNHGPARFKIWDTAGQEKFGGLRDGYYIKGQCAIVMFDVTARLTYKHVPNWHRDVTHVCANIPIVLVGNKVDASRYRKVNARQIQFHRNMKFLSLKCLPRLNTTTTSHWSGWPAS